MIRLVKLAEPLTKVIVVVPSNKAAPFPPDCRLTSTSQGELKVPR